MTRHHTNDERNSKQDAISQHELEALLDVTAEEMSDYFKKECQLILAAAGRLGMRAGEIAHMQASWIDHERRQIQIPPREPCSCGSCRCAAKDIASNHEHLTFEEAFERRWQPKTENSARTIPMSHDARAEAIVTAFFEDYERYPHSRTSINRRVDRICRAAGLPEDYLYPHALRATAATWHAYQGLSLFPLMSLFGWENEQTAKTYVRQSGGQTERALADVHGGVTA
jgi:integrase